MGSTFGLNTVDWEQRVDVDRLRRERLARIKGLLEESELGALLCFDMANIRYVTATHIGTWAMDKLARFQHGLLAVGDLEPRLLQFEHHRRLDDVDADRHVGNTRFADERGDLLRVTLHQPE